MKKYFFGIAALTLAIAFSAFTTRPFTTKIFKLKTSNPPTSAATVQDQTKWIDAGTTYGSCSTTPEDLACTISIDATNQSKFYHMNAQLQNELNTPAYVEANDPSGSLGLGAVQITAQQTTSSASGGPLNGQPLYKISATNIYAGGASLAAGGSLTTFSANY